MTTDERSNEQNFRSKYYKKVGFISVEEKKSLEILLKENRLDKIKLKQFCLRFSVPVTYRKILWKVLLGIVPIYSNSHDFVMSQREQQYDDLLNALKVMRIVDRNTPKPQLFYAMWCLENCKLNYDFIIQQENHFTCVVKSLLKMVDNDTDVYWLAKAFIQIELDLEFLIEKTYSSLEKEDPTFYKYLSDTGLLKSIPFKSWYSCCFAGIVNEVALVRIWDKLCVGSPKIFIFVSTAVVLTMKSVLMEPTELNSKLSSLKEISEDTSEVIVNKAIELWQQPGGTLH